MSLITSLWPSVFSSMHCWVWLSGYASHNFSKVEPELFFQARFGLFLPTMVTEGAFIPWLLRNNFTTITSFALNLLMSGIANKKRKREKRQIWTQNFVATSKYFFLSMLPTCSTPTNPRPGIVNLRTSLQLMCCWNKLPLYWTPIRAILCFLCLNIVAVCPVLERKSLIGNNGSIRFTDIREWLSQGMMVHMYHNVTRFVNLILPYLCRPFLSLVSAKGD